MITLLAMFGVFIYMLLGIGISNFYIEIHGKDHCPMLINILLWPILLIFAAFTKVKDL